MFTIQHVHPVTRQSATEPLSTHNPRVLVEYVARFDHEILAIYEQTTPITKRVRTQLIEAARAGEVELSEAAKVFTMTGMRLMTPA